MSSLIATLARIIVGFALASIAAGLAMVMFVDTPAGVLAQPANQFPETANRILDLALLTATHSAIFGAVFVLIAAIAGEGLSIRTPAFYLVSGVAIAMLGFVAQYASEVVGEPTVLNNYAIKAFLTSGFFGGLVYWLAAGQFAGRPPATTGKSTGGTAPAPAAAENSPRGGKGHDTAALNPIWVTDSTGGFGSFVNRLKR